MPGYTSAERQECLATRRTIRRLTAPFLALALMMQGPTALAACRDGISATCTILGQSGRKECINGRWTACEVARTPPARGVITIAGRGNDFLRLGLGVPYNATSVRLERQAGAGWIQLASSGPAFTDTGLGKDSRYCYRLRASNNYGNSESPVTCAYTRDGRGLALTRTVLRITTGNVEDAGTDDAVSATIAGAGGTSVGGTTWLDHAVDDFQRNSVRSYDLVALAGIGELGDIHSITLSKSGSDAWCVKKVELFINNWTAYSKQFDGSCLWINSTTTRAVISHDMLRADPEWIGYIQRSPEITFNPDRTITAVFRVPRTELESRIEAAVGHSIHGTRAYWGELHGRGVEAKTQLDTIANVDLDVSADVFGDDPEIDVDFNLVANTRRDERSVWHVDLALDAVTANVDFALWQDVLGYTIGSPCGIVASVIADRGIPFCLDEVARQIETGIVTQIPRLKESLNVGSEPTSLAAMFDGDANLVVTAVLPPRSPLNDTRPDLPSNPTVTDR